MADKRFPLDTKLRRVFSRLGIDPQPVFARAGVDVALLSNPDARLNSHQYLALWSALEEQFEPADLARTLVQLCNSDDFSAPMMAGLCCSDLLSAIRRLQRFKGLLGPQQLRVTEADDWVRVEVVSDMPVSSLPVSMIVTEWYLILNLAYMATKVELPVQSLRLHEVSDDALALARQHGIELELGDGNAIEFRREDCLRPFLPLNDGMWQFFEPTLLRLIRKLHAQPETASQVKATLVESLPSGLADKEHVAQRMGISPRTLQKRLCSEKKPFQTVLAEARKELACHYLRQCHLTHMEISLLLGFDEVTSFYRGCQRWFGLTPEAIRKNEQAGIEPAWEKECNQG
ncbi:AraC family transcriptional regulator [Ferrimonas kyonanensis]|uniref:AraC family transcriptional regulator n=1 Tax=Ferrimonas kyonanensis TaxID=364763 RepID=UPI0024815439|nr:AraC family transcriptional regulator ligand-binding domain-containing protein [Ferrimonas kyonanensis]